MTARLLLVGLDGATFDLIEPFSRAGLLPSLAHLVRRGASGPLASTVPPVTFPAWSTILTGRSPARHGLTDFAILEPGARRVRFASARDRRGATLFRLVSDAGGRVAAIGFPTTWPPEPLNGVAVGGFDSPLPRGLAPSAARASPRGCWPARHGTSSLSTSANRTRRRTTSGRFATRARRATSRRWRGASGTRSNSFIAPWTARWPGSSTRRGRTLSSASSATTALAGRPTGS